MELFQDLSFTHSTPPLAGRGCDGGRMTHAREPIWYLLEDFLHLLLENTKQAFPHLAGLLAGINASPDTGLLVVFDDRGGLGVVSRKTLLQRLGVVIGTLNQGLAGDIILHIVLGRVEDLVVRPSRGRVDKTSRNSGDQEGIVDLKLNSMLELLVTSFKHVIQTLSLSNSTREAIQNESRNIRQSVTFRLRLNELQQGTCVRTRSCTQN